MGEPTPGFRLPGVGDPDETKRLWKAMQIRGRGTGRIMRVTAAILLAGTIAGTATALASQLLAIPAWLRGIMCGGLVVAIITAMERSRNERHLRDVLRRESRCLRCGYPLEAYPAKCPECGTVSLAGPDT